MTRELKELDRKAMGARVKARREALGISREELAKRVSVSDKTIANIEGAQRGVTLKNLYKLKQALGVSIDYLVEGNDAFATEEDRRKMISENILGSLSVCSEKQLGCMEQMARLYVESVVDRD